MAEAAPATAPPPRVAGVLRTLVAGGIDQAGGVTVCPDGSLAITDAEADVVLRVVVTASAAVAAAADRDSAEAPAGVAVVVAGVRGQAGQADGAGGAARFNCPIGVAATEK